MVENDIYNNKGRYESFVRNLDQLTIPLEKRKLINKKGRNSNYYIKNPKNLEYFKALIPKFEAQDLSYIRRKRLFETLLFIPNYSCSIQLFLTSMKFFKKL